MTQLIDTELRLPRRGERLENLVHLRKAPGVAEDGEQRIQIILASTADIEATVALATVSF